MNDKALVSVISPAFNEVDSLQQFCSLTLKELAKVSPKHQLIIVDDGSTDGSLALLKKLKSKYSKLTVIKLRRRYGQTAALMAGLEQAQGNIVVTLDADLQQDPKDIARLVEPIKSNQADVVTGLRLTGSRGFVARLISRSQQRLIKIFLGYELEDTNISPNAYKTEIIKNLNLLGEMHRYLIPILFWKGYRIKSIPVTLNSRRAGISKYGTTKAVRGFVDLLLVKFWQDYSARPLHFFGTIGLFLFGLGVVVGIGTAIRKFLFHLSVFNVSLLLLAVFLTVVGLQIFILGILADVMIRIYYKDKPSYEIEAVL